MTVIMNLAATLQTLLTDEANEAARNTRFIQRVRQFSGATFLQTLVFGWLHDPHAPLEDLAELAADLGVEVTPQAIDQRFNTAATQFLAQMLTATLHRVVTVQPLCIPLLQRFNGVYVYDTTVISLPVELATLFPGCGGSTPADGQAALKCHVGIELTTGALEMMLGDGRQPDVCSELAKAPLPVGALRLADRGFFDLQTLRDYTDQEVYWISRVPSRVVVYDAQQEKLPLWKMLAACQEDRLDMAIQVGAEARLPCRLVAFRLPPHIVAKRQQRLQKQAKKKGRKVSAAQWALCGWNVYITNIPAEKLSAEEVWVLTRSRWQIELLFKLWKSHGGLDKSRGHRAERVLCELYAKLVGMVVQHWVLVTCGGPMLAYSYVKAARRLRRKAEALAAALGTLESVVVLLKRLQRRIEKRCRVQKRGGRASTYHLLLDPSRANLQEGQSKVCPKGKAA